MQCFGIGFGRRIDKRHWRRSVDDCTLAYIPILRELLSMGSWVESAMAGSIGVRVAGAAVAAGMEASVIAAPTTKFMAVHLTDRASGHR